MDKILQLKDTGQNRLPTIDLGAELTATSLEGYSLRTFPYEMERDVLNIESRSNRAEPYNIVFFYDFYNSVITTSERGELNKYAINVDTGLKWHAVDFGYFHGRTATTRTKNLIDPVEVEKASKGLLTIIHRFRQIVNLKEGWDTYAAKPIKQETINRAIEFFYKVLFKINYRSLPIPFVVPLEDGGIFFEWRTCYKELHHTIPEDIAEPYTYYKIDKTLFENFEEEKETRDIDEIVDLITSWLQK
ncbi:MAG: hypothetical protein ABIJ41_06465 [Candidatus Omnitrophota bacterium]